MNGFDAVKALLNGKKVRMPTWVDKGQYVYHDKEKNTFKMHLTDDPEPCYYYLHAMDFQVEWELIEDKE